ncbi:hypothetical protein [uncultured Sphingomonas sp.]|uniref:hypothetical protein n=1 Tax=uncultured Sphingomonas sp. TaxID=158754 RepID=UPI0025EB4662|nr:hypothetical protein [uncultured Sphingomonas sp.]
MEAFQAAGNIVQGVAGYEAGKYNQAVANTEAIDQERAGAAEEGRVREAARAAIGQQLAAQGGNGFAMGTGSALDALAQSQVNAALDAMTVRRDAALRARSARTAGAIARAQGDNALVAGMLGAAARVTDWASSRTSAQSGTPRGGR